jgi:beta-barrel assembly-enhancing protease
MERGVYFDGKTSRPYPCDLAFDSSSKSIVISPEGLTSQSWPINLVSHSEFKGVGKTTLQFGTFPFQSIEYTDHTAFANQVNHALPKRKEGFTAFANELVNSGMSGAIVLIILVSSALISVYVFALPWIAEQAVLSLPMAYEVKFGDKVYDSLITNEKIDKKKSKALTQFAQNIDFETKYPLKFTVIDDDQVNAFALPGGHVVVYTEMLDKLQKPEQLVALLGHEVSHIKNKHSLKNMGREFSGKIFLGLIFGDAGGMLDFAFDKAHSIAGLSYSRNMETEADLKGLEVMSHNKLDSQGMVGLMQILQKEEQKTGMSIPAYLSTHPMTKKRLANIQKAPQPIDTKPLAEDLLKTWNELKK